MNIIILEFDHLEQFEKLFQISKWAGSSKNESDLMCESGKCRILCSFHHQINSQIQKNEKKQKKNRLHRHYQQCTTTKKSTKKSEKNTRFGGPNKQFGKCEICERPVTPVLPGETAGFDFDHIEPFTKHRGISHMGAYSWENSILPEIAKCRLLCSNCHKLHTEKQLQTRTQENVVYHKRKRYRLPRNINEEIKINGEWPPTREELYALVLKNSFVDDSYVRSYGVGKMYGVYNRKIQRKCKKYGIPHVRRKLMVPTCVVTEKNLKKCKLCFTKKNFYC